MNDVLLPLLTLLLGALLGLVSSLFASSIQQRHTITLRLLDQYLNVRKSVADEVAPLTNLDLHIDLPNDERLKHRHIVSRLFYTHYDFLPKPVLNSLILLDVCLGNPESGPYIVRDATIDIMKPNEVPQFIERTSLFRNTQLVTCLALKSSDKTVRKNQTIKLHARHVLHTLNTFASIDDLASMIKTLKKHGPIDI